jgi:PAS domain S-box-containing protein
MLSFASHIKTAAGVAGGWTRDWGGALTNLLGVFTLGYVTWLTFGGAGDAELKTFLTDAAMPAVTLLMTALAWRAARHPALGPRTRRAWRIITAAFCAYFVGNCIWFHYEIVLGVQPAVSWADPVFLCVYPLMLWGLLTFPMAHRARRSNLTFGLDAATVMLAVGMLVWYFLLRPIAAAAPRHGTPTETLVTIAFPVGAAVLLFGLVAVVLRRAEPAARGALGILAGGALSIAIADLGYSYLALAGTYQGGRWPDVFYMSGFFLMTCAAQYQSWRAGADARASGGGGGGAAVSAVAPAPEPHVFTLLPYAAVAGGYAMLLWVAFQHYPSHRVDDALVGMIGAAVGLTGLVVARQVVAVRENVRLHAVQEARRAEEHFRAVFDHAGVGMALVDWNGRILHSNPSMQRMLGYGAAELVGKSIADITHPDDLAANAEHFTRLARGDVDHYRVDKRYLRRDGGVVWAWLTVSTLRGAGAGGRRLAVGVIEDVTHRRHAEEKLRFQKALLESQSETSVEGILVVSPERRVLSFNRRFVQMWRLPEAAVDSRSDKLLLESVCHDLENPGEFLAGVEHLYAHPDLSTRDEVQLRDGRTIDRHSAPLLGADGTPYGRAWYFRDVTEDRRAREVEHERNGLRDAVRSLDQVLGVVGHELRTPLAAVRAMSEFMLQDGADVDVSRHFLQAMHDEVVRMSGMVNDMLEVARINSGTARWNWNTVDVAAACGEAVDTARALVADPARVRLEVEVTPPDLTMAGDADAVRRLVLNLLTNACKHTREGSVRVRAAGVRDDDGDAWVELRVADTGAGMSAAVAARLGEAFALNAGVVGQGHVTGTGLGLAICRGVAAAHGGGITVASVQGRGTTVTVRLRADLPAPADAGKTAAAIAVERSVA